MIYIEYPLTQKVAVRNKGRIAIDSRVGLPIPGLSDKRHGGAIIVPVVKTSNSFETGVRSCNPTQVKPSRERGGWQ
jgi:hypothetical protein